MARTTAQKIDAALAAAKANNAALQGPSGPNAQQTFRDARSLYKSRYSKSQRAAANDPSTKSVNQTKTDGLLGTGIGPSVSLGDVLKAIDLPAATARAATYQLGAGIATLATPNAKNAEERVKEQMSTAPQAYIDAAGGRKNYRKDLLAKERAYREQTDFGWKTFARDVSNHTGMGEMLDRVDGTLGNSSFGLKALGLAGDIGLDPLLLLGPAHALEGGAKAVAGRILAEGVDRAAAELAVKAGVETATDAMRVEATAAAREAASKVLRRGTSALTNEEAVRFLGTTGGIKVTVPGTGRILGPVTGLETKQFTAVPKAVTDLITRPTRTALSGVRESVAGEKLASLAGRYGAGFRETLKTGDTNKIIQAFEAMKTAQTGEAVGTVLGHDMVRKYASEIRPVLKGKVDDAIRAIESGADLTAFPEAQKLKDYLRELYQRATDAGVQMNELDNYFPRVITDEVRQARRGILNDTMGGGRYDPTTGRNIVDGVETKAGFVAEGNNATIRDAVNEWAKTELGYKGDFYEKNIDKALGAYIQGLSRKMSDAQTALGLADKGIGVDVLKQARDAALADLRTNSEAAKYVQQYAKTMGDPAPKMAADVADEAIRRSNEAANARWLLANDPSLSLNDRLGIQEALGRVDAEVANPLIPHGPASELNGAAPPLKPEVAPVESARARNLGQVVRDDSGKKWTFSGDTSLTFKTKKEALAYSEQVAAGAAAAPAATTPAAAASQWAVGKETFESYDEAFSYYSALGGDMADPSLAPREIPNPNAAAPQVADAAPQAASPQPQPAAAKGGKKIKVDDPYKNVPQGEPRKLNLPGSKWGFSGSDVTFPTKKAALAHQAEQINLARIEADKLVFGDARKMAAAERVEAARLGRQVDYTAAREHIASGLEKRLQEMRSSRSADVEGLIKSKPVAYRGQTNTRYWVEYGGQKSRLYKTMEEAQTRLASYQGKGSLLDKAERYLEAQIEAFRGNYDPLVEMTTNDLRAWIKSYGNRVGGVVKKQGAEIANDFKMNVNELAGLTRDEVRARAEDIVKSQIAYILAPDSALVIPEGFSFGRELMGGDFNTLGSLYIEGTATAQERAAMGAVTDKIGQGSNPRWRQAGDTNPYLSYNDFFTGRWGGQEPRVTPHIGPNAGNDLHGVAKLDLGVREVEGHFNLLVSDFNATVDGDSVFIVGESLQPGVKAMPKRNLRAGRVLTNTSGSTVEIAAEDAFKQKLQKALSSLESNMDQKISAGSAQRESTAIASVGSPQDAEALRARTADALRNTPDDKLTAALRKMRSAGKVQHKDLVAAFEAAGGSPSELKSFLKEAGVTGGRGQVDATALRDALKGSGLRDWSATRHAVDPLTGEVIPFAADSPLMAAPKVEQGAVRVDAMGNPVEGMVAPAISKGNDFGIVDSMEKIQSAANEMSQITGVPASELVKVERNAVWDTSKYHPQSRGGLLRQAGDVQDQIDQYDELIRAAVDEMNAVRQQIQTDVEKTFPREPGSAASQEAQAAFANHPMKAQLDELQAQTDSLLKPRGRLKRQYETLQRDAAVAPELPKEASRRVGTRITINRERIAELRSQLDAASSTMLDNRAILIAHEAEGVADQITAGALRANSVQDAAELLADPQKLAHEIQMGTIRADQISKTILDALDAALKKQVADAPLANAVDQALASLDQAPRMVVDGQGGVTRVGGAPRALGSASTPAQDALQALRPSPGPVQAPGAVASTVDPQLVANAAQMPPRAIGAGALPDQIHQAIQNATNMGEVANGVLDAVLQAGGDHSAALRIYETIKTDAAALIAEKQRGQILQALSQQLDDPTRQALLYEARALKAESLWGASRQSTPAWSDLVDPMSSEGLTAAIGQHADRIVADLKQQGYEFLRGAYGYMAPAEIVDFLRPLEKFSSPEGVKTFLSYYDKVLNWVKAWQIATPGFHVRNFFGGMFNNFLADVSPGSYRRYMAAREAFNAGAEAGYRSRKFLHTVTQEELDAFRSWHTVATRGQYDVREIATGMAHESYPTRANPFSSKFLPLHLSQRAGGGVEEVLRGSLGMDRMLKGATTEQALQDVYKFHFNYQDLSNFERGTVKRIIPFYTWTRKNFPLQIEMMITRPGKYAWYSKLDHALRQNDTDAQQGKMVPSFFNDLFAMPLGFAINDSQAYIAPDLPFTRSFKETIPTSEQGGLFGTNLSYDPIMAQVTPLIKTPIERALNRQFFKGIPFQDKKFDAPSSWKAMPGLMDALKMVGAVDKKGRTTDRDAYTIEQVLPFLGLARRKFPSEKKYKSRELASWMSWLGIPIRTNTPYEQKMEALRRQFAGKK